VLRAAGTGPRGLAVLADWALQWVPGAAHASFTVIRDGAPTTPASTGAIPAALDHVQYTDGAGPCLDAIRNGQAVVVQDTRGETRWPGYVRAAHEHDILGSLSVPVRAPEGTTPGHGLTAALNVYATSLEGFGEPSRRSAKAVATVAGVVLADPDTLPSVAARLAQASADGEAVRRACQALARRAGSTGAAFAELAAEAERSGRPLAAVARDAVAGHADGRGTSA
jgi:hypothetical protein